MSALSPKPALGSNTYRSGAIGVLENSIVRPTTRAKPPEPSWLDPTKGNQQSRDVSRAEMQRGRPFRTISDYFGTVSFVGPSTLPRA